MFKKIIIDLGNKFGELCKSAEFENITNGRKGAVLVDYKNELVPLVRTTTPYQKPAQKFSQIHYDIIEKTSLKFNNAMIEIYDGNYRKMGYHTDQSLDLADDSYICLFSCYDDTKGSRKLQIKEKATENCSEIALDHNSAVLFSVSANSKHLHKIILSEKRGNQWLGITLRLSKTFIKFVNEIPYFHSNNKALKLATDDQIKELRKYKSAENANTDYKYPELDYTISPSDLLSIK